MSIHSNVKDAIKTTSPDELEARGIIRKAKQSGYVCPVCGNGSGRNGTGVSFTLKGSIWVHNCPRCGRYSGDNINLFADKYGLDASHDFVEVIRHACADLGIAFVEDPYSNFVRTNSPTAVERKFIPPAPTPAEIEFNEKYTAMIRADIERARANLHNLPEEDRRRLPLKVYEDHGCGYLPAWRHPKSILKRKNPRPTPRIIIPTYGGAHYNAVLPTRFRNGVEKQYHKMHAGTMETFALERVTVETERVFVYEGELNAMSAEYSYNRRKFLQHAAEIFEAGTFERISDGKIFNVVALPNCAFIATLGAGRAEFVKEFDEHCKALGTKPLVVIMFDNDDTGYDKAEARKNELSRLGYRAAIKILKGDEAVESK